MSRTCCASTVLVYSSKILFAVTDIECPPLPVWTGLIISSQSRRIGSVVNTTCGDVTGSGGELRFVDSSPYNVVECTVSGQWNATLPACVGKSLPEPRL